MWQGSWPLEINIAVFIMTAAAIGLAGTRLAGLADRFADRTGLGEALTGTLFLGLLTALPGLAASITAALENQPAIAVSNALGGIAVQTTFLALADISYRKANLEHASASISNMMQTVILVLLMSLVLLGLLGPDLGMLAVHPVTPLLIVAAVCGFWTVYRAGERPMWRPEQTTETVADIPAQSAQSESLPPLLVGMAASGGVVLAGGAVAAHTGTGLAAQTGLSGSVVGGLFIAIATSLPELVTTVAAVRRGALTLAVGDIVGGNFFDVLFVAVADLFYRRGSIYHADGLSPREPFLTALAIALNLVLLMGLIYRQERGPGNIGFESVLMLLIYAGGFLIVGFLM